ncbi:MAG: sortase [Candidatus Campbellbacteria bacterium]|nr:sortase [Candidatus Campbellbacteria bacterium]
MQKKTAQTRQKNTYSQSMVSDLFALLKEHPVLVGILWSGFFIVLLGISFALGLVPKLETETPTVAIANTTVPQSTDAVQEDSAPVRIIIERIGVDTLIVNPESRDIEILDTALLSGAVRYPGSGDLEDVSNIFLFGHSTGFRVVQNQAFKAFSGLKDAREGDLVRVQSKTKEYVYRVTKVSLVNEDEVRVNFSSTRKKLTLSTCNSFGQKEERYVVESDFVGSYDLTAR